MTANLSLSEANNSSSLLDPGSPLSKNSIIHITTQVSKQAACNQASQLYALPQHRPQHNAIPQSQFQLSNVQQLHQHQQLLQQQIFKGGQSPQAGSFISPGHLQQLIHQYQQLSQYTAVQSQFLLHALQQQNMLQPSPASSQSMAAPNMMRTAPLPTSLASMQRLSLVSSAPPQLSQQAPKFNGTSFSGLQNVAFPGSLNRSLVVNQMAPLKSSTPILVAMPPQSNVLQAPLLPSQGTSTTATTTTTTTTQSPMPVAQQPFKMSNVSSATLQAPPTHTVGSRETMSRVNGLACNASIGMTNDVADQSQRNQVHLQKTHSTEPFVKSDSNHHGTDVSISTAGSLFQIVEGSGGHHGLNSRPAVAVSSAIFSDGLSQNSVLNARKEDVVNAAAAERVSPQEPNREILTHVIEGFIIQEGPQPFPIQRSLYINEFLDSENEDYTDVTDEDDDDDDDGGGLKQLAPGEMRKCHVCPRLFDPATSISKTGRYCSVSCSKRTAAECRWMLHYASRGNQPSHDPLPKRRLKKSQISENTDEKKKSVTTSVKSPRQLSPPSDVTRAPSRSPIQAKADPQKGSATKTSSSSISITETTNTPLDSDAAQWGVTEVYNFIQSLSGCGIYAEDFRKQEIDGQALLLLTEEHLMTTMNIKLGPALKICSNIRNLRACCSIPQSSTLS